MDGSFRPNNKNKKILNPNYVPPASVKTNNANDEIIEEILGFNIKVRTNTGREKLICFSDIKHHIGSSLALYNEDDLFKIEFKMDCLGFTKEIVEI